MKAAYLLTTLLLTGCQLTEQAAVTRPTPELVISFSEVSPGFNNRVPVLKAVEDSEAVLVVAVANKDRAAMSSERVFSVANVVNDRPVYTAFRYSHLHYDLDYVEVYGLRADQEVGVLLAQIKAEGVGELNERIYSESAYRRFTGDVDDRTFMLSGFVALPEQLAGLVNEFGWQLRDGGAFLSSENDGVVLAQNLQMNVVTVDKHTATLNEIRSIVGYWESLYPAIAGYQFSFDVRSKTITYQRG